MERLWFYCGTANIAEEDRQHINMKNEFYYSRVMVTFAKKSYVGLQKRQEEVVFKEPKIDVKGVNFFKSTASEDTSKFIYDKVLMGELLDPPDEKISLRRVYYKANIREFLSLKKPAYLYSDIACADVEFIDPNIMPEEIKPMIDKLTDWVLEFVAYKHGIFRYEDRTRYQKRKCTIVID